MKQITNMVNILVTGALGQLGSEINSIKSSYTDYRFFFTDIADLDITDSNALSSYIKSNNIQFIINCAAYTAVDKAESDSALCEKINTQGVKVLAQQAHSNNATLIHISTDYVFDGTSYFPYNEDQKVNPLSVYGRTKLLGEEAVKGSGCKSIIIRTSWLYSSFGNNFVKTMRRLGGERESLNVIFDQVGTPTYAYDLAVAILSTIEPLTKIPTYGEVFHFSNEGVCSWYDFSKAIMDISDIQCKIMPIETKDYPVAATRPIYSVLNKSKIKSAFNIEIPYWRDSLEKCIEKL